MTAEDFRQAAQAIYGSDRGWQTRAADGLGIHQSQVSRYLAGAPIPKVIEKALEHAAHAAKLEPPV